jgi:hypothetical protein
MSPKDKDDNKLGDNDYTLEEGNIVLNGLVVVFENKEDAEKFIYDNENFQTSKLTTYTNGSDKENLKEYNKQEDDKSLNYRKVRTVSNLKISEKYIVKKTDSDKIITEINKIKIDVDIQPSDELIKLFENIDYKKHLYNDELQKEIIDYTLKIKPLLDLLLSLKIDTKISKLLLCIIAFKVPINKKNESFFDKYSAILEPILKKYLI